MHILSIRPISYAICASLLLFGGCGALLYGPEAHVVPLFERGGQARLSGQVERNGGVSGYAAMSPLRHTFAFAAYRYTEREAFAQRVAEYGGGVYVPLGAGATIEVLAGVGRGRFSGEGTLRRANQDQTAPFAQPFTYRARQRSCFAQVALGGRPDDGLLAAGVLRLADIRYSDLTYSAIPTNSADLATAVDVLVLEPGLLFRGCIARRISFEGQLGLSVALRQDGWNDFERHAYYSSVGLHIDLLH